MTAPQAPSATPHASDAASRYQPRAIEGDLRGRHIVSVEQFARPDLDGLCRTAAELRRRTRSGDTSVLRLARRKIMASVFYEASTRTDMSFQAAMLRMGGEVIATSGGVQFSSVYKGENLADTVRAVGCYADVLVLRHPEVALLVRGRATTSTSWRRGSARVASSSAAAMASASTPPRRCSTSSRSSTGSATPRACGSRSSATSPTGARSTRSRSSSRSTGRGARISTSSRPRRCGSRMPIRAFVAERAPDITMTETDRPR